MAIAGCVANPWWPQRILVCDDERHIARLIQVNLERLGHTVVCAFDGEEAIQQLESAEAEGLPRFDKIVLDVMMPKMDGFEVLQWIRSRDQTRDIWVAMMISRALDPQHLERLPYRPDKFITKPFNPIELVR